MEGPAPRVPQSRAGAHRRCGGCLASPTASGLATGHPKLRLTASRAQGAAKIASLAVALPAGLKFAPSVIRATRRCVTEHHRRTCTPTPIKGLSVSGAGVKTVALKGGTLLVTLKRPAVSVTAHVSRPALIETSSLQNAVKKHKVTSVTVTLEVTDARHTTTSVPVVLDTP